MDDKVRVDSVLKTNEHMVIATADNKGKPWVTPVAYTFDSDNSLYWVSSKDSQHSSNIRDRAEVAIVIYMTEPKSDALYIDAIAKELVDNQEILDAIEVRNTRVQLERFRVKTIEDVSGLASWRIYKAKVTSMYFRKQDEIGGQLVTSRRKIV